MAAHPFCVALKSCHGNMVSIKKIHKKVLEGHLSEGHLSEGHLSEGNLSEGHFVFGMTFCVGRTL